MLIRLCSDFNGTATELEEFKERNRVKKLEADLEFEKERAKGLEKRLDDETQR